VLWTVAALAVATYAISIPIRRGWIFVVYFLFAIPLWIFIVPMVLRDVWRKTREPKEPPIVIPPEPGELPPGESIFDRKPPSRW
jgi:hypothetical protein